MTALDNANVSLDTFRRAVEGDADAMAELDAGADTWIEALGGQNMKLATVSEQAHKLRDAYKENITAMVEATQTADGIDRASAMVEATQTADGIDRAYANLSAGMGELGTTLKANGDAMSDLSSMSDASRGALQQFSASVWQNVDSIIANADAYGGMDQAVQTAKNRVQEMRDALIGQLQALGQTPEQAAAVADALGLIPSNVTTDVKLNAGDAKLEVQAYLDTLNLTPEQKTTFMQALTEAANGNIDGLKLNMGTLPDIVTSFLKADPSDANAQLNAVSAQLQLFGLMEPTALLKADNSDAEGKTAQSTTSVRTFGTQTATAKEDADNSSAITKTDAAKGKVQEYGGIKATAVVDVMDNASGPLDGILGKLGSIASGAWNAVVNMVTGGQEYGGIKATAVVDVMDNASGPLDGILGKLGSIASGAWNAVVNMVTGGGKAYGGLIDAVVDVMDNASGPLDGILGKLGSIASGAWNAVVNMVTGGGKAYGGLIDGGRVTGPGSRVSDTAQITPLSAGEYVIRAKSASRIGYTTLDRLNRTGTLPDTGPGSRVSDTAQITPLSAGEYVIRAKSASRIGYTTLDRLNRTGTLPDEGAVPSSVRKTGRTNTTTGYADERVVALLQRILLELEAGQRIELDGREMGRTVRRYARGRIAAADPARAGGRTAHRAGRARDGKDGAQVCERLNSFAAPTARSFGSTARCTGRPCPRCAAAAGTARSACAACPASPEPAANST